MAVIYLDSLHVDCYFDSSLSFSCVSTDTACLLGRLDSVNVCSYPVEDSNFVLCVLDLRIDENLRVGCILGIDYFAGIIQYLHELLIKKKTKILVLMMLFSSAKN